MTDAAEDVVPEGSMLSGGGVTERGVCSSGVGEITGEVAAEAVWLYTRRLLSEGAWCSTGGTTPRREGEAWWEGSGVPERDGVREDSGILAAQVGTSGWCTSRKHRRAGSQMEAVG